MKNYQPGRCFLQMSKIFKVKNIDKSPNKIVLFLACCLSGTKKSTKKTHIIYIFSVSGSLVMLDHKIKCFF